MGPEIGSVFSNLITLLKNVDSQALDAPIKLSVGQTIKAQVVSKEGELYLLKSGDKKFYAKAQDSLEPGQRILLEVLGAKEDIIVLKRVNSLPLEHEEKDLEPVKQIMRKYGVIAEKDVQQVQLVIKDIPCEPAIAAKYLLDPHLLTALLMPTQFSEDNYNKIEVNRYKNSQNNMDVFEVSLELELQQLGHIEIAVKYIEGSIYTRIWTESKDTSELLKAQLDELQGICPRIELIPVSQGPLIVRDMLKKVDVRI